MALVSGPVVPLGQSRHALGFRKEEVVVEVELLVEVEGPPFTQSDNGPLYLAVEELGPGFEPISNNPIHLLSTNNYLF